MTPSQIAGLIRAVTASSELDAHSSAARVRRFLDEALDSVADGMPADHAATFLYAALGALAESEEPLPSP